MAVILLPSKCLRSTMQNSGGCMGLVLLAVLIAIRAVCALQDSNSLSVCPCWRTVRMTVLLSGCWILSIRPPTNRVCSSSAIAWMAMPSKDIKVPP